MNPSDNVFWLGYGMGALSALVAMTIFAVLRAVSGMLHAQIPPFTGEQHDGRP